MKYIALSLAAAIANARMNSMYNVQRATGTCEYIAPPNDGRRLNYGMPDRTDGETSGRIWLSQVEDKDGNYENIKVWGHFSEVDDVDSCELHLFAAADCNSVDIDEWEMQAEAGRTPGSVNLRGINTQAEPCLYDLVDASASVGLMDGDGNQLACCNIELTARAEQDRSP